MSRKDKESWFNKFSVILILLGISLDLYAQETNLVCRVSGFFATAYSEKKLEPTNVSVVITKQSQKTFIFVSGPDDFTATVASPKMGSIIEVKNFSDDNQHWIANKFKSADRLHSTDIQINRVTGILSVSIVHGIDSEMSSRVSYSGPCEKQTVKKF